MDIFGGTGGASLLENVTTAARLDRLAAAPFLAHFGQADSLWVGFGG